MEELNLNASGLEKLNEKELLDINGGTEETGLIGGAFGWFSAM
ncbi:MAG: hypothetical protein E6772_09600 [Dysgonomonas sp.]|nr:hypothetical protein [Dysgonomonas sp.]